MVASDPDTVAGMRRIGALIAAALAHSRAAVAPGVSTGELDRAAAAFLRAEGARSGPILTYDYPGFICVSVDDQVVHGIPGDRRLRAGQLVTLDIAAELDGFHADAATTVPVGPVSPAAQRLMAATHAALAAGIRAAQPGASLRDIGAAVERVSTARGFTVFRDLTGHGIGTEMHEDPTVYNFPFEGPEGDQILREGMVFTIEPMLGAGGEELVQDRDGWTMRTRDGSLSAHEEHTIIVGEGGPVVLTAPPEGD
ncbi:type I methionyl aminopeptidase [Conexibacter sp. DBS9H8]|uniref:type I methionyl aminopeptidase n=1 Tax=Conexibacter sp. DBS9H8 TaxID=2937801 RepID=UPI00200EF878|nr:type I methionyl aminopeptidase [Conexibacter sp. DBS9H8]